MYIYKEESVLKSKCKADPEIRFLGLNKKQDSSVMEKRENLNTL